MRKLLPNQRALQPVRMHNQNGILILTSFNGLLGSDEEDMQNQKSILNFPSLSGILGSD